MKFDKYNSHRPLKKFMDGIEGKRKSPFSQIEFLANKNDDNSQSNLDKLASEEFDSVYTNMKTIPFLSKMDTYKTLIQIHEMELTHRKELEQLAVDAVSENFGLSKEIKEKLKAKIVDDITINTNISKRPIAIAESKLTNNQKFIAKKYIDKRIIQNALSMGSGYRAHKLFKQIKPAIDEINPALYRLYNKAIGNMELHLWKNEFEVGGARTELGKCQINPKTLQAESQSTLFVILLHEVAKSAIELLFLQSVFNIADDYGNDIYNYVMLSADRYEDEQWMKLIGPRLWKYLHDAINYIIESRENDYTIFSYLLNKISLLPPEQFLDLISNLISNGPKAIEQLETLLDELENDIEEYKNQIE